jgi:hypothetical protein
MAMSPKSTSGVARNSDTILRGHLIDRGDPARLIAQDRSPSYSKTVWGCFGCERKNHWEDGRSKVLAPVS